MDIQIGRDKYEEFLRADSINKFDTYKSNRKDGWKRGSLFVFKLIKFQEQQRRFEEKIKMRLNKYKDDIIFDHLNLSHHGQVTGKELYFDKMIEEYEDKDFKKYKMMIDDNVPIHACLKRSKSAENLLFGGKTVLEKKYSNLPLPYTKYHINKEIKRFHAFLIRKCDSFK